MSDQYGACPVPLDGDGTDPLLTHTLAYFRAISSAYAGAEWSAIAPGIHAATPIATVFDHDPEECVFNERDLPALFLWRSSVASRTQIAQDIRVEAGELSMFWVPPTATQATRRQRFQFAAKLLKVLDTLLERERDPAWFVPGDLTPFATPYCGPVVALGSYDVGVTITGPLRSANGAARMRIDDFDNQIFSFSVDDGRTWTSGFFPGFFYIDGVSFGFSDPASALATGQEFRAPAITDGMTGSLLSSFAKFRRLQLLSSVPAPVLIEVEGGPTRKYPAWLTKLSYEEELTLDAASRFDAFGGVDTAIQIPPDPLDGFITDPLPIVTGNTDTTLPA